MKKFIILLFFSVTIFAQENKDSITYNNYRITASINNSFFNFNSTLTEVKNPNLVNRNTKLDYLTWDEQDYKIERRLNSSNLRKFFLGIGIGYTNYTLTYKNNNNRELYLLNNDIYTNNDIDLDILMANIQQIISYSFVENDTYIFNFSIVNKFNYVFNNETRKFTFTKKTKYNSDEIYYEFAGFNYSTISTKDLVFSSNLLVDFNFKIKYFDDIAKLFAGFGAGTNLYTSQILQKDKLEYRNLNIAINISVIF